MIAKKVCLRQCLFLCCILFLALPASSQQVLAQENDFPLAEIKTNLLNDMTATFNLGVEFRLSNKTSLNVSGNWNPWTFDNNRKWKHILVQPGLRLWTKETFREHFFGIHVHYAYYNAGNLPNGPFSRNMKENRYEGWLTGAGVGYGYRWNFARRWGLEAEIGVGYAYMNYDKFNCVKCGEKLNSGTRHYFGPTKAAVSLVYSFGRGKKVKPAPVYVPVVVREEIIAPAVPRYAVSAAHYLNKIEKHNADGYNSMDILYSLQGVYNKAAEAFEQAAGMGNRQAVGNLNLLTKYREDLETYERKQPLRNSL